jgi:hypothetical protein
MRRATLLAVIAAAWATIAAIAFSRYGSPECGEQITHRELSPRRNKVALTVVVNCGATSGFVTVAAVQAADRIEKVGHNYFFSIKGEAEVHVRWADNDRPVLRVPPRAEVLRKSVIWDGMQIEYE